MWPHAITFDCYGTLVQWPETLRACFRCLLPEGDDIGAFHRTFTDIHARLRDAPYDIKSVAGEPFESRLHRTSGISHPQSDAVHF